MLRIGMLGATIQSFAWSHCDRAEEISRVSSRFRHSPPICTLDDCRGLTSGDFTGYAEGDNVKTWSTTQMRPRFRTKCWCALLALSSQPIWALNPHPRIWLDSATRSTLASKVAKGDADWLKIKSYADTFLGYSPASFTITAATNSNPVQFTISGGMPVATGTPLYIGGATGAACAGLNSWTCVNNPSVLTGSQRTGWTTTVTGANTFTIPLDSTQFGPFSGQALSVFAKLSAGNRFTYDYEGSGWFYQVAPLALAYQATGNAAYAKKAIDWLDYYNSLSAVGISAPLEIDSGYPDRFVPVLFGIIYDWCYDQLNYDGKGPARIAASIKTAAITRAWIESKGPYQALPVSPISNYAAGHLLGQSVLAYAMAGDDPNAQADIDWAAANWNIMLPPAFQQPRAGATGYTGIWLGGAVAGVHYDLSTTLPYYTLYNITRASAGDTNYVPQGIMQAFATNMLYDVKPDNWAFRMDSIQTGTYNGVFSARSVMLLEHALSQYGNGTTDGSLAAELQYQLNHLGATGNASEQQLLTDTADLFGYVMRTLFLWSSRTATPSSRPTARFAGGVYPRVYWRSDWSPSADWIMFYPAMQTPNASAGQLAGDTRVAGEIDINRGTDHLIVNAQNWFGSGNGTIGTQVYGGIYAANDLASTLFFYDGGNKNCQVASQAQWGGQVIGGTYPGDPLYRIGSGGSFLYTMGDITQAYVGGCSAANRTLRYWYRTVAAVGNGTYVVADRTLASAAGFKNQVRWHFNTLSPPALSGNTVSQTVGSSNLFVTTVLPASPTLNLVSDGTDHCSSASNCSVNYREEVSDAAGGASMNVLTVIFATGSGGKEPVVTSLSSFGPIDANHQGVQIADTLPKVVVYGWGVTDTGNNTYASARSTTASFTSTHSGTGSYLVDGLQPGTYSVSLNGTPILVNQPVGQDGTLSFSSTSGRITILQTGSTVMSCDLNADGSVDVLDVQMAVSFALGTQACPASLTVSGACVINAGSVDRVVTAALGGACILP